MNTISHRELRCLNDGLVELYATHDLLELAKVSIRLIRGLIPNDLTIYTLTDRQYPVSSGIFEPSHHDVTRFGDAYRAHCMEHPLMRHFYRTRSSAAIRFADTIGRAALEKLELYNNFFRPLRAKDLLGIRYDAGDGRELAIGSARDTCFSERERDRLEFLRPHLSRAFANAALIARARRKPFGPACLLTPRNGSMVVTAVKAADRHGSATLTPRELEILHSLSEGRTTPEIGVILGISPRTVQKHIENLFRKLNVSSRTGAAIRAIELGVAATSIIGPPQ